MGKEDKSDDSLIKEIFGEKEAKNAKKLNNFRNPSKEPEVKNNKNKIIDSDKKSK